MIRKAIQKMTGYVSGEQPSGGAWVKLNTNENPYPPSPKVVEAIRAAAEDRLNVYPDALATPFRETVSSLFGCGADCVLPGNGSDENLTMIMRAFCDPGDVISYPYPSYVLYETLAEIQDCRVERIPLDEDWQWSAADADAARARSKIVFVPNPNSPSGTLWTADQLRQLIPDNGVLIVDEAYADFCDCPAGPELLQDESILGKVIVTRTLSKSYSLAGLRFGFLLAPPDCVAQLRKVKDSYNCDRISIAAAKAAFEDQEWMQANRAKIVATRTRLDAELSQSGFLTAPSQANFVWATHPSGKHREIYEALKARHVLIRYMKFGDVLDGIRTTVGTDDEIDTLLSVLREIMPTVVETG